MTKQRSVSSTDLSVSEYTRLVSSASPTPGGGSVSGVTGALAASLAEMVCALTLSGDPSDERRVLLEPMELFAEGLRQHLLELAVEDEAAYESYRTAAALPKTNPDERAVRTHALQQALADASTAPLTIAQKCVDLLTFLPTIAAHGTRHALSDASASAVLAEAALRCALLTVRVNADLIKAADITTQLRDESARLEADGQALLSQTLAAIASRSKGSRID